MPDSACSSDVLSIVPGCVVEQWLALQCYQPAQCVLRCDGIVTMHWSEVLSTGDGWVLVHHSAPKL